MIDYPHFIRTEIAKSTREAPLAEHAAMEEKSRVTPQENLTLAAKIKPLRDISEVLKGKMRSMQIKMKRLGIRIKVVEERCQNRATPINPATAPAPVASLRGLHCL